MKMESMPNIGNTKNKIEDINVTKLKDRIISLVSDIKEKYPAFEKVVETPGKIVRLLTVLVALEGGQLFAQDISNKNIQTKNELNTIPLTEIQTQLNSFKLPLPEGKIKFSENYNSNGKNLEQSYEGIVPTDTGMVGDVGIFKTTRVINRYEQIKSSKEEDNSHSRETILAEETKVLDGFKDSKIEKSTDDIIKIYGRGQTKQDAVMDAMRALNTHAGEYVSSGSQLEESGNLRETIETKMTEYITMDSMNIFKNLHIDKIEEVKEGDFITFHVYVSAQKGQLKTVE